MRALARLTAAAVLLATLAGCAQSVSLTPAADATNPACASTIVRLPETAGGLPSRETNAQGTAAYGSPATVLLRCGVPVPDPTSALTCITVNGIDWLRDPTNEPVVAFITYGRDPATEVVINGETVNGQPVLDDLSSAIGIVPAERSCISPDDAEGGADSTGN